MFTESARTRLASVMRALSINSAESRSTLRLALAVCLSFAIAEALNWPAPFIAAVLTVQLVLPGKPCPPLADGVGFVLALGLSLIAALLISSALVSFMQLYVLIISLLVFLAFYLQASTTSPAAFLLLVAFTVVPILMVISSAVAQEAVALLMRSSILAVLVVWAVHAMLPDPPNDAVLANPSTQKESEDRGSSRDFARTALLNTVVVMPIVLTFILTNVASAMVIVFSTLSIVQQRGNTEHANAALGLMLGNIIGGVSAVIVYGVMFAAPSFPMLVSVLLLVGLVFGWRIFTSGASTPLFVIALITTLILFGTGLSPFRDAGTAFVTRLIYVMLAGAYTVGMLAVVEPLRRSNR